MRIFIFKIIVLFVFLNSAVFSQKPTPTPAVQTGKSYSTGQIKRPATTARQYPSPVVFMDITAQTKINFRHQASVTPVKYLPETMGAGVALVDINNDGRLDVFFTNGALIKEKMPEKGQPGKTGKKFWDRLYLQKQDGSFEDITEKAGINGVGYSFGVATGDFNRDGFQDIFVTHYGGVRLYQNKGDLTFTDVTEKAGIKADGWGTSTGFFDFDKDGRLDIFIARYVNWDFGKGSIFCGDTRPGYRAYCHPDNFASTSSVLLRQKVDGTFEDVSEKSKITRSRGKALGVDFADFDNDGWTDIFVANDNIEQQLFQNKGDGTFEELALPAGVAFDERGNNFAGMGIDAADYNNDGLQDVIITALSNETYPIYRNIGDWGFDYVTQTSGVAEITVLGAGWGIKFIDVDNDGKKDIFVAQSHVLDTIEKTTSFLKYKQTPLLMRNVGKKFQNVSFASGEAFQRDFSARGLAAGDLDNDGNVDIVISQMDGTPLFLRNEGAKNNWIGLDLRGERSAPNGEGARIIVTDEKDQKQYLDVSNSGSYLSANDHRILVGTGSNKIKEIEIRWPAGGIQKISVPVMNKYHSVKEEVKK
jgi:hypothetical protein